MTNYEDYTDEELVLRINKGEDEIADFLIGKYKKLVLKNVKSLYILGGDNDDLIQEGMIGLYKAIRDYNPAYNAKFSTFANICVSRQILTAIQASKRDKHKLLNEAISLNSVAGDSKTDEENVLINAVASLTDRNPEELLISKWDLEEIEKIIDNYLSPMEAQTIRLFMAGETVPSIAMIIGKEEKAADNALQRAKQKIKKNVAV